MIELEQRFDTAEEMTAFMRSISPTNIYDDIKELQQKVAGLEDKINDTCWLTLPLAEGIKAYNESNIPQYRKIGNIVAIRGSVKGITKRNMVIATLPEGFRPLVANSYVQNTCLGVGYGTTQTRMVVTTAGDIKIEAISDNATFGADKWFQISTIFLVD